MRHLGIPVPDGFVVSAKQFHGRSLGEAVSRTLLDAICAEIERRGWAALPLAIRSSAVHEDAAEASFAGIYRSVLNVQGRDATGSAVRDVLDSYFSEQARAYRERVSIASDESAMAVIVMPLLHAVASGVAFTCDPISGREDRIVINATRGLADALVNAQIEGDEYVLARSSPTRVDVTQKRTSTTALSHEALLRLGQLLCEVADALDYTHPQYDIEWVWDGQRFWIVQARPITTRAHVTYPQLVDQLVMWSRANSAEVVPHPFAALDWSLAQQLLQRMLTSTTRLVGYESLSGTRRMMLRHGRLYYETSIMQWEAFDAFDVPPKAYNRLLGGGQPEISVPKASTRERLTRASRSMRFMLRSIGPRMRATKTIRRVHEVAAARARENLPRSAAELVDRIRDNVAAVLGSDELHLLQAAGSALFVLLGTLEKYCGDEAHSLAAALMAGGKPSVTAAQNLRLLQLAQLAADDSRVLDWLRDPKRISDEWKRELPDCQFRNAFQTFVQDFGHRGVYESYLCSPRWRESPGYLFDLIVGLVGVSTDEVGQRQSDLLLKANKRLREVIPFWMRPTILLLVKLVQAERRMREGARSALIAQLGVIRRLVLARARCLKDESGASDSDALFHLTIAELDAVANGRIPLSVAQSRVAWRRNQLSEFAKVSEPDVVIERTRASAATLLQETDASRRPAPTRHEEWFGTVIAAGSARGIAHVARHPSEAAELQPGSILVASATDPAWTPIFLKTAAVVVEVGGYLSHSAIVAREFGIPALANVHGILSQISSGDLLEIDGERGCVRRIGNDRAPATAD
jgi:pyruvate,water dikinase